MPSITDQKSALRREILQKRDAMDEASRIEKSLTACDNADTVSQLTPENFVPGTIVAGFNPIRSEIDPRPLMANLATMGARLCLPVVVDKTTIEFRELVRGAPMVSTGFGTFGPDETAQVLEPSIILTPLSVFDRKGGRIGYGGGYYDRVVEYLITKGKPPILIGLAFFIQEIHIVPMEAHDRFLDGILTEEEFIKINK